jgi:hypothetical protein
MRSVWRNISLGAGAAVAVTVIAVYFLWATSNDLYVRNGLKDPVRIVEVRINGAPLSFSGPFELVPGNAAFFDYRSAPIGNRDELEISARIGSSGEQKAWKCELRKNRNHCFFPVWFSEQGLLCHPCESPPSES